MNSLTITAQGEASGVRQGRSRWWASYQPRTVECSTGNGSGSAGTAAAADEGAGTAGVTVMAAMALRSSHVRAAARSGCGPGRGAASELPLIRL